MTIILYRNETGAQLPSLAATHLSHPPAHENGTYCSELRGNQAM